MKVWWTSPPCSASVQGAQAGVRDARVGVKAEYSGVHTYTGTSPNSTDSGPALDSTVGNPVHEQVAGEVSETVAVGSGTMTILKTLT